ncbi:unnamed protein product, partial [Symbiodinium microadriaticum]
TYTYTDADGVQLFKGYVLKKANEWPASIGVQKVPDSLRQEARAKGDMGCSTEATGSGLAAQAGDDMGDVPVQVRRGSGSSGLRVRVRGVVATIWSAVSFRARVDRCSLMLKVWGWVIR